MCLAGGAQAFTHHPSTKAERAQTRALNEEQLKLAQDNASPAMSANSMAPDASANVAANSPQANIDATLTRPPGSGPTSGR
jgi:hypothetical protein